RQIARPSRRQSRIRPARRLAPQDHESGAVATVHRQRARRDRAAQRRQLTMTSTDTQGVLAGVRRWGAWLVAPAGTDSPYRMSPALKVSAGVLVVFVSLFFAWASFAELDSAVIAGGVVSVEGKHKRIQHLEGGIVEKILVNDGDTVKAGQQL